MDARRSVFLVEDHPVMAEALALLIESEPSLAVSGVATSAEMALDVLGEARPDLVLVDMRLPAMSGLDLVARLRDEHPEMRCLLITAFEADQYAREAQAAGAVGIVDKGKPDRIIQLIHRTLGPAG